MEAALRMEGTRFRHQGRTPGIGLDCAGVVVCSYGRAGHLLVDQLDYDSDPPPDLLGSLLRRNFGAPMFHEFRHGRDGDVVEFLIPRAGSVRERAVHCGIKVQEGFVHVLENGFVGYQVLTAPWAPRVQALYGVRP